MAGSGGDIGNSPGTPWLTVIVGKQGPGGNRLSCFKRSQVSGFLCVQFLQVFYVDNKFMSFYGSDKIYCWPDLAFRSPGCNSWFRQWKKPCWFPTREEEEVFLLPSGTWVSPSVLRIIGGVVPWRHPEVSSWILDESSLADGVRPLGRWVRQHKASWAGNPVMSMNNSCGMKLNKH